MNTPLEAQEVITRAGNFFVNLKNEYLEKKREETNVYRFIESTKAVEILDQAVQFFVDFQKELDERSEPTQYYADQNPDTPKPLQTAEEETNETSD